MAMHDLNCHHPKPVFSRKHYETVADALHEAYVAMGRPEKGPVRDGFFRVQEAFVAKFLADNHLFDEFKFRIRIKEGPILRVSQR